MSATSVNVVELKVPVAGESITEGVLGRWLVEDGSFVRKGQPVFELETDKTNTEVPSPESGRLQRVASEGATVAVHAVVARITVDGDAPKASTQPAPTATPATAGPRQAPTASPQIANGKSHPVPADVLPTPLARALMSEHGLTSAQVKGTGSHGRIRREDVLNAIAGATGPVVVAPVRVPAKTTTGKPVRRERMTAIRRKFIERLVKSTHAAAILTTFNEVDMSAVLALIARHGEGFAKRHGAPLRYEAFFVKAAAASLMEFPRANAMIELEEVISFDYCDVSLAVDSPKGEAQPVLRSAHEMNLAGVARWIHEVTSRATRGELTLRELSGATFGIVNDGAHGALIGTPPLHAPQTATLGLHAIRHRVVCDEKKQPALRPMMYLALAYDHRLLDGKDAVEFLTRVKELVEDPGRLLLDC